MSYLSAVKNFFGYNAEQIVEPTSTDDIKTQGAVCVKKGYMTMEELCQIIAAYKTIVINGAQKFQKRVEDSITLTPSDIIKTKNHEVKKDVSIEKTKKSQKVREERTLED